MKTFLNTFVVAITFLAGSLALSPAHSLAACSDNNLTNKEAVQCGVNNAAGGESAKPANQTAEDLVVQVINILSLVGGALAVIMLIYGGLRYVISAGSPEATKSARNTIIYALVGLVIIAAAQVVVQFVLVKANNATAPPAKSVMQLIHPNTLGGS
jgi:ABC-type Fe3+ transport system permease subunit